ncbi:hypothetical protein [Streptomyces misionensis]|uniref:hypothetical protein n=1 Tax=Streptomyces misionensis TaxID=67331 RepID=UPI0036A6FC75
MTEIDLDAIDTAADAATPGPWDTYQYGGLIEIAADLEDVGCGYSARRTITRLEEEPMDNDPSHREWSAEEDWGQVQADAAYIAAMPPEVAKALVAEVRRLRDQVAAAHAQAFGQAADELEGIYARDYPLAGVDHLIRALATRLRTAPAARSAAV